MTELKMTNINNQFSYGIKNDLLEEYELSIYVSHFLLSVQQRKIAILVMKCYNLLNFDSTDRFSLDPFVVLKFSKL